MLQSLNRPSENNLTENNQKNIFNEINTNYNNENNLETPLSKNPSII